MKATIRTMVRHQNTMDWRLVISLTSWGSPVGPGPPGYNADNNHGSAPPLVIKRQNAMNTANKARSFPFGVAIRPVLTAQM